jgi:hypothetical protein
MTRVEKVRDASREKLSGEQKRAERRTTTACADGADNEIKTGSAVSQAGCSGFFNASLLFGQKHFGARRFTRYVACSDCAL